MSDTPGKVLSTLPAPCDKRRGSRLGGCAAIFFQIFNGRRLFSRKSLPAGRPKQSLNHTDDKLPIAKLLLIADENLSSFSKESSEDNANGTIDQNESCDSKLSKRTPGVVARLMGLETLPSSEPTTKSEHLETKEKPEPQELWENAGPQLPQVKAKKPSKNTLERYPKPSPEKIKNETIKQKASNGHITIPPCHIDVSYPSLSPKKGSPVKKASQPTPGKRTTHIFEAAAKIIESDLQKYDENKSQKLRRQTLPKKKNGSSNSGGSLKAHTMINEPSIQNKKQNASQNNGVNATKYQDDKEQHISKRRKNEPVSRKSLENLSSNQDLIKKTIVTGKSTQQIADPRKVKIGTNGTALAPKKSANLLDSVQQNNDKSEKVKTVRKQSKPQSSKGSVQSSKTMATKPSRHSRSSSYPCKSLSSQAGSNNIPPRSPSRNQTSSVNGCVAQTEDDQNSTGAVTSTWSFGRSKFELAQNEYQNSFDTTILEGYSVSETDVTSQIHDGLSCEDKNHKNQKDAALSQRQSHEFNRVTEEHATPEYSYRERSRGWWATVNNNSVDPKRFLDIFMSEDSTQSSCESFFADSGDTASSHDESEISSKTCDSAKFGEKNTATILQELLVALSSSRSHPVVTTDDSIIKSSDLSFPHSSKITDSKSQDSVNIPNPKEEKGALTSIKTVEVVDNELTASTLESQIDDYDSLDDDDDFDHEFLMGSMSKLRSIHPEVVKLIETDKCAKGTSKLSSRCAEVFQESLSVQDLFNKLEQRVQCMDFRVSVSSSCMSIEEEDTESLSKSGIDVNPENQLEEAAVQNKKLVSDCVNEAFSIMGKQMLCMSSFSTEASAAHVLSRVYKQIDEWRAMSIGMNLDDMVEKEMNSGHGKWSDFSNETEKVAEIVESTIIDRLLDELVLEMM